MTLLNIIYIPKYNFTLILLGQLQELGILYYDHSNCIILKSGASTLGIAGRHKNFYVLKTGLRKKVIFMQKRNQLTDCYSSNLQILLWHCCFDYAGNAKIVQAAKLIDGINLREVVCPDNELYFSNFKSDNKSSNINVNNESTVINKVIENNLEYIKQPCKAYIKSKYTRIIKSKKMMLIIKRL